MAYDTKVKTSRGAGRPKGERWDYRANVKLNARKARRAEDRREVAR